MEINSHLLWAAASPCASMSPQSPSNFFECLKVEPFRGRTFVSGEHALNTAPGAVVSFGYWQRHLGSATDLTKLHLRIEGAVYPVCRSDASEIRFSTRRCLWIPRDIYPKFPAAQRIIGDVLAVSAMDQHRTGAREPRHDCSPHQDQYRKKS